MLKPVVRPSPFATQPEASAVSRPDSSFTGTVSAFAGALSTTSNVIDRSNLLQARRTPEPNLQVTDEDLLRGQQPEDHEAILLESNTYGKHAGQVMAAQVYQDRQNQKVMQGTSGFKSLLYGGAAILADPVNWIPMATGAKVAMGVTKMIKPTSSALATATGWSVGGAVESVAINTPRLMGDHTYHMEQYQKDLLLETMMAGGIGMAFKYGSKAAMAGKQSHIQKQKRLEETFERNKAALNKEPLAVKPNIPKGKPTPEATVARNSANVEKLQADYDAALAVHKQDTWNDRNVFKMHLAAEKLTVAKNELAAVQAADLTTSLPFDAKAHTAAFNNTAQVQDGSVAMSEVKKVLDGMPPEVKSEVKGTNAVFGNLDESGVEIPDEVAEKIVSKLVTKSGNRIATAIERFTTTGEKAVVENAAKAPHALGWVGHHAGRMLGLTRDMSSTLRESDSEVLNYLGAKVLELGKGYGGVTKRQHSAAVIKEAELTQSLSKVLPSYYRSIKEWVGLQGENSVAAYNAANKSSAQNALAQKFNKEFLSIMNKRNLGKDTGTLSPPMERLAKDWDNYMDHNFDKMVSNGIEGFNATRKVKSYVPQIWNKGKIAQLVAKQGEESVHATLVAGYRSAGNTNPESAATAMMEWLRKPDGIGTSDPFLPKVDARAQERMVIDWDAEVNGITVMDMLDIDAPALATRYSNRMSGWIGLSKSTDGALSNGLDINTARQMMEQELKGKGQSTKQIAKKVAMFEETMNLIFGRPPVAPLDPFINNLKELAVLSRMGGLGMAQAAESGVVATRSIMEASADPKFLKKVLNGADTQDIQELTRMSGYDADYALLSRQSVDQVIEEEGRGLSSTAVSKLNKTIDFLTFGSNKAAGSRALGQVTGYDAIRKLQSYASQRSFGMSVARHFNGTETKLSNGRLADWGLTDTAGKNTDMQRMFKEHVEFDADGYPVKYNFDKWDTKQLDDFRYAMQRMEAQTQARALAGELPQWMNKPIWGIITQFRQMAITTQNKTLARNLALADQEAAAELTLATMSASLVRAVKIGGLAAVGSTISDTTWEADYSRRMALASRDKLLPMGADLYINHFGAFSDVYNTTNMMMNDYTQAPRQIPMLGLMEGYMKTGGSLAEGDLIEAGQNMQRLAILGNTAVVESLAGALFNSLED